MASPGQAKVILLVTLECNGWANQYRSSIAKGSPIISDGSCTA